MGWGLLLHPVPRETMPSQLHTFPVFSLSLMLALCFAFLPWVGVGSCLIAQAGLELLPDYLSAGMADTQHGAWLSFFVFLLSMNGLTQLSF